MQIDIVHFIDDDVEVLAGYFDSIEERFEKDPHLAGVGGAIQNARMEAHPIFNSLFLLSGRYPNTIRRSGRVVKPESTGGAKRQIGQRPVEWLQGFAMSYRMLTLQKHSFDDRLTGYSYGEDRDFSFRVSRSGKLAVEPNARCLHLRATANRLDSRKFGFEVTTRTYAWVSEYRTEGFSLIAFFWSVFGDVLRHIGAALINRAGVSEDPLWYALGVLEGVKEIVRSRVKPRVAQSRVPI
jgi:GT2 family glycosyltransferase